MANSKIVISFNSIPAENEYISFISDLPFQELSETFVASRVNSGMSAIGVDANSCAFKYKTALGLDYNSYGLYNISVVSNFVTIEAKQPNVVFSISTDSIAPSLSYVITNEEAIIPISFITLNKTIHNENPCDYVEVNIETNILATRVYVGKGFYSPTNNTSMFIWARGSFGTVTVEDTNGNKDSINFKTPALLLNANVIVGVSNSPNGATVTTTLIDDYDLVLEYSLNGINWQSLNVFTGQLPGAYTMYVKDQFGCVATKTYSVTLFAPIVNIVEPFSYISKAMSIRYKKDELWDYIDIYRNDDNTLSCEEFTNQSYKYIQKFKPSNLVKTQLLSNYENIDVNILKEDGSRQSLTVSNMIKFLDIKDKRDARIYSISPTKAGIYYVSGDLYDYTTGLVIGTYVSNGALPNYGIVGNYLNISGFGWVLIEDIIYNEALNCDVLVVSYTHSGQDMAIVVSSNYNQKNYNVYEFTVDFSLYLNEYIQVEIIQSKTGFSNYNYLSEVLEVRKAYDSCIELIWYNKKDTFVYYSTGIKNVGNFEFITLDSSSDSGLEIHKTTNTSILIEANAYETKKLVIDSISTGIMYQLIQASLHKQLFVNRVRYISNNEPEIETEKFTNFHQITLSLTRTQDVYNAEYGGGTP